MISDAVLFKDNISSPHKLSDTEIPNRELFNKIVSFTKTHKHSISEVGKDDWRHTLYIWVGNDWCIPIGVVRRVYNKYHMLPKFISVKARKCKDCGRDREKEICLEYTYNESH